MKLLGNILIGFAVVIAVAGILAITGPRLQEWGLNVSGAVYPWPVWVVVATLSLVFGIRLRRRVRAPSAG